MTLSLIGAKCFSSSVDTFLEGIWCAGKQTESHKIVISLVNYGEKTSLCLKSPSKYVFLNVYTNVYSFIYFNNIVMQRHTLFYKAYFIL